MCGRFTITLEPAEFLEELDLADIPADFIPRYNVAPNQPVMAVRDYNSRHVEWMKWGLVPFWAKDPSIGVRMINARSETLLEKPSFRQAFLKRRCLILADGFFEWQKFDKKRPSIPHYFYRADKKPFFFAGLWDQWQELITCTIITCAPNELVGQFHDRMPVMLNVEQGYQWLNSDTSQDDLSKFLSPFPANLMKEHEVGKAVNQALADFPGLIEKAEANSLFQ